MARVFSGLDEIFIDPAEFFNISENCSVVSGGRTSTKAYYGSIDEAQLDCYKSFSATQEGFFQTDVKMYAVFGSQSNWITLGLEFYDSDGGSTLRIQYRGDGVGYPNGKFVLSVTWGSLSYANIWEFTGAAVAWKCLEIHWYAGQEVGEQDILQIRLGGSVLLNYVGSVSRTLWPNGAANRFYWSMREGLAVGYDLRVWLDNIALNNPSGALSNGWVGDLRMIARSPDESVLQNWQQGGAVHTNNYEQVDEWFGNEDTDYLHTSSASIIDTFKIPSLPADIDGDSYEVTDVAVAVQQKASVADGSGVKLKLEDQISDTKEGTTSWAVDYKDFSVLGIGPGDDFTIGIESA